MGQFVSKTANAYNQAGRDSPVKSSQLWYGETMSQRDHIVHLHEDVRQLEQPPQLIILIDGTGSMANNFVTLKSMLENFALMFELYGINRIGFAIYTDYSAQVNSPQFNHVIHAFVGDINHLCGIIKSYVCRGNGSSNEASSLMLAFISSLSAVYPPLVDTPVIMIGDDIKHNRDTPDGMREADILRRLGNNFPVDHLSINIVKLCTFNEQSSRLGLPETRISTRDLIEYLSSIIRFLTGFEVRGFKPTRSYLKINHDNLKNPDFDLEPLLKIIENSPVAGLTMIMPLNVALTKELNKRHMISRWAQIIENIKKNGNHQVLELINEFNRAKTLIDESAKANKAAAMRLGPGIKYFAIPDDIAKSCTEQFTAGMKYFAVPIEGLNKIRVQTATANTLGASIQDLALFMYILFGIEFGDDGISMRAAIMLYSSIKQNHQIYSPIIQLLNLFFARNLTDLIKWVKMDYFPMKTSGSANADKNYEKQLEIPPWYNNLTVLSSIRDIMEYFEMNTSRVVCFMHLLTLKTIASRKVDTIRTLDNSYVKAMYCPAGRGYVALSLCADGVCVYCDGIIQEAEVAFAREESVKNCAGKDYHSDPRSISAMKKAEAQLRTEIEAKNKFTKFRLTECGKCGVNYPIMDAAWTVQYDPLCHDCRYGGERSHTFNCESCGLLLLDRSETQTKCIECQQIRVIEPAAISIRELSEKFNISTAFNGLVHNLSVLDAALSLASILEQLKPCKLPLLNIEHAELLKSALSDQNCFIGNCTVTMCSNRCCTNPQCDMKACAQCMQEYMITRPGCVMPSVLCACGSPFNKDKFFKETGQLIAKGAEAAASNQIVARCLECKSYCITEPLVMGCGDMDEPSNFKCGDCIEQMPAGRRLARHCPKCNVITVRTDDISCAHMHCSNCNTHWCWLCLGHTSTRNAFYSEHVPVHGDSDEVFDLVFRIGPNDESELMTGHREYI